MPQIVIAADLSSTSPNRDAAWSTYEALRLVPEYDVSFMKLWDQTPHLKGLPHVAINEITNAVIIAFREIQSYMNIDRSNTLVYMTNNGNIESYMSFMIHRVDRIVTTNYRAAFKLCAALQQLNLTIPVHRVQPWLSLGKENAPSENLRVVLRGDSTAFKAAALPANITYIGKSSVAGWNDVESISDWSQYDVYVCLDSHDEYGVCKAMASGVVPIVINRLPYTEFVMNAINGWVVSTPTDAMATVGRLAADKRLLAANRASILSYAYSQSPEVWARLFYQTVTGTGAENLYDNDLFSSITPTYRRWIVPKIILENGKRVQIPRIYNKHRFKVVELGTLEEILQYFTAQRFMDIFIFDWEYGEYNAENYNRIMNLARAIGRRGLNMYWCVDDSNTIPAEWREVFKTMTILPVAEGLKKVRPPASGPTKVGPQQQPSSA